MALIEFGRKLSDDEIEVCLCKSIMLSIVKSSIKSGAHTLPDVHRASNSGNGACHGRWCTPTIHNLLRSEKTVECAL